MAIQRTLGKCLQRMISAEVSGTAINAPAMPQIHVQTESDTMTAIGVSDRRWP